MAILTETNHISLAGVTVLARAVKAAQNDVVVFPYPGVTILQATLATGAVEAATRPVLVVNNTATAYDAATTTIAYDGATASTRPASGYYAMTSSGEILYVEADSGAAAASGNLTVRRGCLGTTPSAIGIADDNTLYVLCSVTLSTADTTGIVNVTYLPLPEDPGAVIYQ